MHCSQLSPNVTNEIVARAMAMRAYVRPENTVIYSDLTDLMTELLTAAGKPDANLVTCGHYTPDIAVAAGRADLTPVEILGKSPFRGDLAPVFGQLNGGFQMVYLANPNRVTGACYSLSDIESLARKAAAGVVIVDEYYFNYLGVSAFPLLENHDNLVILRPLTAPPVEPGLTGGFALGGAGLIAKLRRSGVSTNALADLDPILAVDADEEEDLYRRTVQVCGEARRLTTALRCLGVACRHTPTDFVLMQVVSPKDAGNFLAGRQVTVENLDGYLLMGKNIRYFVRSHEENERLVDAFREMPEHYFRPQTTDFRACSQGPSTGRGAPENHSAGGVPAPEGLITEDS
ncbi:MAG: aminotransferase class I/II-fold pyridoxal phosphate-dependent enzyme [Candidatus Zixiibacteriota bacterium]|nr:MAG: aminotransferase class I/II-fold pyridoxal phosphate-dependent enzyme [candidate division Zixibacteria bacterium]